MLKQIIRTAVISALGAKLAKGRSPLVAALVTLLATRMLAGGETSAPTPQGAPDSQSGLQELIEKFRQGGFEDIIKSWIGTGTNKNVTPSQLQQALGSDTVDELSRQAEMPKEDLLSDLSRILPDIIDKLTPRGQLPPATDLVAMPGEEPQR